MTDRYLHLYPWLRSTNGAVAVLGCAWMAGRIAILDEHRLNSRRQGARGAAPCVDAGCTGGRAWSVDVGVRREARGGHAGPRVARGVDRTRRCCGDGNGG